MYVNGVSVQTARLPRVTPPQPSPTGRERTAPISPSPAGRSPQRGRVGVGVEASMSSPKQKRHPNLPRLVADENPGNNCCDSRLPSFSCEEERWLVRAANVKNGLLIHQQYRSPPPQSSPAADFALQGRGILVYIHLNAQGVCGEFTLQAQGQ